MTSHRLVSNIGVPEVLAFSIRSYLFHEDTTLKQPEDSIDQRENEPKQLGQMMNPPKFPTLSVTIVVILRLVTGIVLVESPRTLRRYSSTSRFYWSPNLNGESSSKAFILMQKLLNRRYEESAS